MSGGRSRRRLQHGRPTSQRQKTPRYLIVTNGEVTESDYFRMRNVQLGRRASLKVRHKRLDPESLARHAEALRDYEERKSAGGDSFAKVFVVTDVDLFTLKQFRAAKELCDKSDFRLVITNPCFEVWLIDHLETCSCRGTQETEKRAKSLGLVRGGSDKELNSELLRGKLNTAISNARRHNTRERSRIREQLSSLDFAPWTDMATVEDALEGMAGQRATGANAR